MRQIEYIQRAIEQLNAQRAEIPEDFAKEARELDAKVEALVLASNNGPEIVALRMKKEEARTRHTARAASLGGQVEALTEVFNRYHQNPVPPGTVAHGIDVSVLDWETRARVMSGDAETVALLGGTMDLPVASAGADPAPAVEPTPAPVAEVAPPAPAGTPAKRRR